MRAERWSARVAASAVVLVAAYGGCFYDWGSVPVLATTTSAAGGGGSHGGGGVSSSGSGGTSSSSTGGASGSGTGGVASECGPGELACGDACCSVAEELCRIDWDAASDPAQVVSAGCVPPPGGCTQPSCDETCLTSVEASCATHVCCDAGTGAGVTLHCGLDDEALCKG